MKKEDKEIGGMVNEFDSYLEDGKLIIVTFERGDSGSGRLKKISNTVSLKRAKEILKDLQDNISKLEKA